MDIFDLNGDKIRQMREALNWSRDDLFEKSGVPARTIQDIENGTSKNPGIETMKSILSALPNYPSQKKVEPKKAELLNLIGLLPSGLIDTLLTVTRGLIAQAPSNKFKDDAP